MPCNGVAVTQAEILFAVGEYFQNAKHRKAFESWMREQGHVTRSWWRMRNANGWALAIESVNVGVAFVGNEMHISDEGDYRANQTAVDKAYAAAQVYVGQLMQVQVLESLKALGLNPRDMTTDRKGTVTVRVSMSAQQNVPGIALYADTARVSIALDGSMSVVTEDGDFDIGRKKLETLLAAIAGQGVDITPSNEYETHRHDQEYAYQYEGRSLQ